MKERLFLLFFVFLFVLASAVLGVQESGEGLRVVYPKSSVYDVGSVVSFHFTVFNSSGFLMDNGSVSCHFMAFDGYDDIIYDSNLSFVSNAFLADNINSSVEGFYSYNVWCLGGGEAGFVSGSYEVTRAGWFSLSDDSFLWVVLATFGVVVFFAGLMFKSDDFAVSIVSGGLSLIYLIVAMSVTYAGYLRADVGGLLKVWFFVSLILFVGFAFFYLWRVSVASLDVESKGLSKDGWSKKW